MRILPREHGATAIWFSSLVLTMATTVELPSPAALLVFAIVALSILIVLGRLTRSSATLIKIERNRIILPVVSGFLTLLVLLGHWILTYQLPREIFATWILFTTYTVAGVAYTQATVRAVKGRRSPALTTYMIPLTVVMVIESVLFDIWGWLNILSLMLLAPLYATWFSINISSERDGVPMGRMIRGLGFRQTANMIAAAVILAVVARL